MSSEIEKISALGNEIGSVRTTVDTSTQEGKIVAFNALQNAESLRDHTNEDIALVDIVQERTEFPDEETGEISEGIRTTLIDASGNAYQATSSTLAANVNRLFGIFGNPRSWSEPLKVKAVEKKSGKNAARRYIQLIPVTSKETAKSSK